MAKTFCAEFIAIFLFASAATAQSIEVGGHTIVIKDGPEFALCERVLEVIEQVGEAAIGQCRPSELGISELNLRDATHFYLRWSLIRDALPPDFAVPDWQERYLSDPEWYAEAAFLTAQITLWYDEMYAARIFSDAEIRQIVEQYLRDGTLPYEDGRDHARQILPSKERRYFQADFAFRDLRQTISRFGNEDSIFDCEPQKEYHEFSSIFFIEPSAPEAGIIVNKSGVMTNKSNADILTFNEELYHMRNPNRFLAFERDLPFPETDPVTRLGYVDACLIEILPNGS